MKKPAAIGISSATAVATWFALVFAFRALGAATGPFYMCPQAPDWWITLYWRTNPLIVLLLAPVIGVLLAVRLYRSIVARASTNDSKT